MRRAVLLVVVLAAACDNRHEARVGAAVLPQVLKQVPLPKGATTVVVMPGVAPTLPAAGPVQLAIDVNVPWSEVRTLARAGHGLVVGDRDALRGFQLEDVLDDDADAVRIFATAQGKFCLSPPGTELAYCMESSDRTHISAAFVREVMRKAVDEYGITQAHVDPDDDIKWADLVRTIDGARTCCKVPVKVALLK